MSDITELARLIKSHREIASIAAISPTDMESAAVVIGAYKGDTIHLIRELYHGVTVYGYEPQKWAFDICNERFVNDYDVHIDNCALGTRDTMVEMGYFGTDACSIVNKPDDRPKTSVYMRDIVSTLRNNKHIQEGVSLAVINIEGYEYELIPYMSKNGLLDNISNVVIQLHGVGNLSDTFNKTHNLRWWSGAIRGSWFHWVRV